MSVEAVLTPIKYAKALKQLQDSQGCLKSSWLQNINKYLYGSLKTLV